MPFTILVQPEEVSIVTPKGSIKKDMGFEEYQWVLSDEQPMPDRPIWYLMADGKELEFIRMNFANIPISIGVNQCLWKDDMARFIFDNLVFLLN